MKNTTTLSRMYVPSCHGGKIHIESEVILPDYCPDAAKIVKTELSPKITSQSCFPDDGGLNISLDGTALFKVLYLSDGDSGLCSTFFTQPFSHSFKVRTDESTDMENIFDYVQSTGHGFIPKEEAYFEKFKIKEKSHIVIEWLRK